MGRSLTAPLRRNVTKVRKGITSADWPGYGIVCSMGFFALVAQTLLVRVFLAVFEGSELGIACFYSSWLVWVAVGAWCARALQRRPRVWVTRFEFLPLLYLAAFGAQWWVLSGARAFLGIPSYELFPLRAMLLVTVLGNAPVSLCTGLLFTLACQWLTAQRGSSVARVYAWECIGSSLGGIVVTVMLSRGMASEAVFVWTALVMTLALATFLIRRISPLMAMLPALVVTGWLLSGQVTNWERANHLRSWSRFFPAEAFRGAFSTPEAAYLYGEHRGEFQVVSWDAVRDSIPDAAHASEVIAVNLAQRPDARRFLVVGPGTFAICQRLLDLPQTETVTWMDPDPAYPALLRQVLPPRFQQGMERLDVPQGDIRRWLASTDRRYDLAIVSFPNVTTLALNRSSTREFHLLLRGCLAPSGAIGVRVPGGENYMSEDLLNIGASTFHTLRSIYAHMALKPGDESWLFAADSPGLTNAPAVLRDRYAAVHGAERLFPPAALMSLYSPQRSHDQTERYEHAAKASGNLLLDTDRSPKALLHGLLFSAREQSNAGSLGSAIRLYAGAGRPVIPIGLGFLLALRCVYALRYRRRDGLLLEARTSVFDCYSLVATTGCVGMGTTVVLMYAYQSVFGSLFLDVGLLSALFMLGLSVGAGGSTRLIRGSHALSPGVLAAVLIAHLFLCAGIATLDATTPRFVFAAGFMLSGLLGGAYVPLAAERLNLAGISPGRAGSALESADHLGGAVGGLVVGLLVLPIFGSAYSLLVLSLVLAVNIAILLPAGGSIELPTTAALFRWQRPMAYLLFGSVAFLLASSHVLRRGAVPESELLFDAFARASAAGGSMELREQRLHNGRTLRYRLLRGGQATPDTPAPMYAVPTEALAPQVLGYGGPLALAVLLQADGTIRDLAVISSRETPAYLSSLRTWMEALRGRRLFAPAPLTDVDAVTGATLTSAAVISALRQAGPAFAAQVLGMKLEAASVPPPGLRFSQSSAWLLAAAMVALLLRYRPSRWRRRAALAGAALILGLGLNTQYSLAHVLSLVGLAPPLPGWNAAFLLAVGVPLLVLAAGNVYCGYLCPFGALQELAGDLRPAWLDSDPDKYALGCVRFIKYLLLAALLVVYAFTLQDMLASADPLVTFLGSLRTPSTLAFAVLLVALAVVYPRLWCRGLCPAGAFLALLNGIRPFRRLAPVVNPHACIYGVRDHTEMDCLCCDRCRSPGPHERRAATRPPAWRASAVVNAWMLAAAIAVASVMVVRSVQAWNSGRLSGGMGGRVPAGRGARTVDMTRLKSAIREGRLSDRPARFYQAISPEHGEP